MVDLQQFSHAAAAAACDGHIFTFTSLWLWQMNGKIPNGANNDGHDGHNDNFSIISHHWKWQQATLRRTDPKGSKDEKNLRLKSCRSFSHNHIDYAWFNFEKYLNSLQKFRDKREWIREIDSNWIWCRVTHIFDLRFHDDDNGSLPSWLLDDFSKPLRKSIISNHNQNRVQLRIESRDACDPQFCISRLKTMELKGLNRSITSSFPTKKGDS